MSRAEDQFKLSALEYTDAKRAVENYEGPRRGPEFEALVRAWQAKTKALTSSARAFANDERSRLRIIETDRGDENAALQEDGPDSAGGRADPVSAE